jgi:acetyl esterase/lipase
MRRSLLLLFAFALLFLGRSAEADPRDEPQAKVPPVERNLVYATAGDRALHLDLYRPAPSASPAPVVLWLHGGAWRMGSKLFCPIFWLRDEGFAVASVDYRLSGEATWPAQIHDVKAAVRWLRANAATYGFDAGAIGVAGASAGGHLAALLGTSGGVEALEGDLGDHADVSSRVAAVYDMFGPTDLVHIYEDARVDGKLPKEMDAVAAFLGGERAERKERARLASPLTWVSPDDPPFLIVHGEEDFLVPVAQSVRLEKALRDVGVPATLVVIPGASHGGLAFLTKTERHRMLDFFRLHLFHEETAAVPKEAARIREAVRPGPFEIARFETPLLDPLRKKSLPIAVTWPVRKGPCPVIVFSHGAFGSREGYRPLVDHWASHGWVVVQPTHEDSLSLRKGAGARANPFRHWRSRIGDVRLVLDDLEAIGAMLPGFEGTLDTGHVAVAGHSFGAHTAQLLAGATTREEGATERGVHRDGRPKAFLLISPQGSGDLLDADSWTTMTPPVMVITGTEDRGRGGQPFNWRTEPWSRAAPGEKFLAVLQGADHGFGGIAGAHALARRRDPAMVDRVRALSLLFLEAEVRGDEAARAALAQAPLRAVLGPEVRLSVR